ncbi:hypothetical protein [Pedobacter sp. MW01-1-1]|uniref:hypothetical protein n=1 Tax=Pedobacter sp. MW01-1-1 TaxID=3383027 RepID=UPI003FF05A75
MAKKQLNNEQKTAIALDLFLNTDKTQKQICEIVGWTEKTFKAHKDKGNWDILKGAQNITAQNIISELYLKIERIVFKDKDNIDADKLIKVAKSIESLSNRKVTLSQHINCAKEFTTWFFGVNPDLAKEFNKYQQQFITERASQ